MDLGITTVSTGGSDQSWLASRHGLSNGQSRTLDLSKFTSGTHYNATTKVVPSGVALGIVTATGLAAPFDAAASDGTEVLDSFLIADEPLLRADGSLATSVIVGVTVHAFIHQNRLPVVAQRTTVEGADTTGIFTYQD
ncbi:hypothetical protein [Curtobacterium sp. Curtsp57]|uniref:hypothetical protein n=1 Tax=Curtobacterium sp. Curtsp57 TaxID=3243047 RepID=UPI0039B5C441